MKPNPIPPLSDSREVLSRVETPMSPLGQFLFGLGSQHAKDLLAQIEAEKYPVTLQVNRFDGEAK